MLFISIEDGISKYKDDSDYLDFTDTTSSYSKFVCFVFAYNWPANSNLLYNNNKCAVFWEGHKIWKDLLRTFDMSVVFCARNSVLVKKIFINKCGQVILYKLYKKYNSNYCFLRQTLTCKKLMQDGLNWLKKPSWI